MGFIDALASLPRRIYIVYLGLIIYGSYKVAKVRLALSKHTDEEEDEVWNNVNKRTGKQMYKAIVFLQGLWVKVGQYMSTRSDVLPEGITEALSVLQDAVPAKPIGETLDTIKTSIGDPQQLFASFDMEALATASIAQVHRAKLKDGQDVVVKVQHKNIASKILRDLSDFETLVWVIAKVEPEWDMRFIVNEWCAEVPSELDFVTEATNTTEVDEAIRNHNRSLADDKLNPLYLECGFAEPINSLTKTDVFVMSYIDGFKVTDVEAMKQHNVDVKELVTSIIKAYAFQIFDLGLWNGDPHPGNFLIAKNETGTKFIPYLLDFGLTKRASAKEALALSRLLLSAFHKDFTGLQSALIDLGVKGLTDNVEAEKSMEIVQFIFRSTTTRAEAKAEVEQRRIKREEDAKQKKLNAKAETVKKPKSKIKNASDAFPGVLVFFTRVLFLLRGLSTSLDVNLDYLGVMAPFALNFLERETRAQKFGLLRNQPRDHEASELIVKLETLLRNKIESGDCLGAQVVAMKRGKVIVDIACGVLGLFDPRPVKSDSLFPVFSVSKAVTSIALHQQVALGRLAYDDLVSKHWPAFIENLDPSTTTSEQREWKSKITVRHLLNHESGLEMAGKDAMFTEMYAITNFDLMVSAMETAVPARPPGVEVRYQALSFGWLVGGLVQKVSGEKFGDLLRNVLKEIGANDLAYVGIPKGVEERLATLFWDSKENLELLRPADADTIIPNETEEKKSGMRNLSDIVTPTLFNDLKIRKSVIPAASGNMSAKGMAMFMDYVLSTQTGKGWSPQTNDWLTSGDGGKQGLFDARISDEFVNQNHHTPFQLGFAQYAGVLADGTTRVLFGHSGFGGSTVISDPVADITVAVTVNKLSMKPSVVQGVVQRVLGLDLSRVQDVTMNPSLPV